MLERWFNARTFGWRTLANALVSARVHAGGMSELLALRTCGIFTGLDWPAG